MVVVANLKSVVGRLKTAYRKWEAGAEERAARKIARAGSMAEREKVVHSLRMEKLERKRQLEDATAKAKEAEARRRRAERSIKATGSGSYLSRLFGTSSTKTSKRKSVRKRK